MRDILRKQPVLLAIGLLALGSVLAVVDAPWASEDATSAADAAANGENEIDVTAAESGEEIQASTPADEMDTRVRSIRRNEYFYQSYGRKDLFAALVTGDFEPKSST